MRHAVILNVSRRTLGAEVEVATQPGDTVLHIDDVGDLVGFASGEVRIGGNDATAERVLFDSVDEVGSSLALDATTPVSSQWPTGTPVELWPIAEEREAQCFVDGQVDGDALVARIPHAMEPLLLEGTRDPGLGESAWVEEDIGGWYIADILGQEPTIGSGAVAFGGLTDDLRILGYDPSGELLADLNSSDSGVAVLRVGQLISDSVAGILADDVTMYADPDLGSDLNDGSVLLPLATVQEALDRLPRGVMGDVVIDVTDGAFCAEALDFSGFFGSGSITVELHSQTTTVNGSLLVDGCSLDVTIASGTIDDDGSVGDVPSQPGLATASVYVRNSRLLTLDGTRLYAHGAKAYNVNASAASVLLQGDTEFHGATDYCVNAGQTAAVTMVNTIGSSSGGAVRANGSTVRLGGTRPTGALDSLNGGRFADDSTGTASGGGSGGGSKQTRYWASTSSRSWRNAFGGEWRDDTTDVFQGQWGYGNHRGCFFYDVASIRSVLAGKTIDAAYIYLVRRSAGGISGPVSIAAWNHDATSGAGGMPNLSGGPAVIGQLAWGQARWLKLPTSLIARIRSSTSNARGIALYVTDGSPYGIFAGHSISAVSGKLKVVYHG